LGCPGKKIRSSAAPALLGVAAAIALSAQAPASASTTAPATHQWSLSSAKLLSAIRSAAAQEPVTAHKPAASLPAKYTVRPGDSLSAIARNVYHDPGAWPVLYWANRGEIRWANEIGAGQVLTVPVKPAHIPAAPSQLAPAPAPAPAPAAATQPTSTQQTSTEQSASTSTAEPAQTASTYTGGSSFQECVIARESGGNSQVMNSSGHYGLYQFSASTWAAYGGNPADFGNASVAEQNQVFDNAIAAGGQSNWSAYDGC
jgi:LysM repeat protein